MIKRFTASMAAGAVILLCACSSSQEIKASPQTATTSGSQSPNSSQTLGGQAATNEKVHYLTFTQTTGGDYSYIVEVYASLGKPTLDAAEATPGTTNIVVPIILQKGTLTNATVGGANMSTAVDNIGSSIDPSLFIAPALPAGSYTCTQNFPDLSSVSPYAGCARTVVNLLPEGETTNSVDPIEVGAGKSIPLELFTGTVIGSTYSVTVNVPTADAAKVAADFSSADICLLQGDLQGFERHFTAGNCG
jgi:hypothetical protein